MDSTTVIGGIIIAVGIAVLLVANKSSKDTAKPTRKKIVVGGPYTLEEVSKHNKASDCWIIVDNKVYDVTDYIDQHPGGDTILHNAGGDSSEGAHGPHHPPSMWDVLIEYYIGDMK